MPWPTWYMPQEKAPKAVRKMATALGPLLGMRRANRTGANPPGGGPSWRTGMSFTLAIPGFFLICASVIFLSSPRSLLFFFSGYDTITTTMECTHARSRFVLFSSPCESDKEKTQMGSLVRVFNSGRS